MNPYTPIRRLAQGLLAEVQGIVAEVTLLELQEAGVRVVDTEPESAAPVDTAPVKRRGRPRKVEAPPEPLDPGACEQPRPRRGRPPRIPGASFEPAG